MSREDDASLIALLHLLKQYDACADTGGACSTTRSVIYAIMRELVYKNDYRGERPCPSQD